jgi:hypothetical protein
MRFLQSLFSRSDVARQAVLPQRSVEVLDLKMLKQVAGGLPTGGYKNQIVFKPIG